MMSAAVKGKTVDEARELIRAFKAMMSIHEAELAGEDGAPEPEPRRSSSATSRRCRAS